MLFGTSLIPSHFRFTPVRTRDEVASPVIIYVWLTPNCISRVYDILLGDKCLETSVLCLFYNRNRLIFVPVIKWYKNDSIIHEGKYNRTKS